MFSYDIVFCMLLCKFFLVFQISPVTCVVCHSTQQSGMKGSYSIGIFVKLKTYCSRQDVIYENSCYILYSHLIVLLCCIISRQPISIFLIQTNTFFEASSFSSNISSLSELQTLESARTICSSQNPVFYYKSRPRLEVRPQQLAVQFVN